MILRITLPVLSIAGGLLFASNACARERSPVPEEQQQRLLERFGDDGIDADGDGTLTREEIRAFVREHFGDVAAPPFGPQGRRHRAGPGAGPGPDPVGETLGMLDRLNDKLADDAVLENDAAETDDQDAAVAADRPARGERLRARLTRRLLHLAPEADADADGTLDENELADLRTRHRERVKAFIIERHPEADVDEDGTLSDEELDAFYASRVAERHARMLERHPEADLDGDGILSESEIDALREKFGPPGRDFRGPRRGPRPFDADEADEENEE